MDITISQEKLKEGLLIVDRISAKSPTLLILNNIQIAAEKNFITIKATDLELGISWWSLVKIKKEGIVVVPSKTLTSFVSFLPNKPLKLISKENTLLIEWENNKTQFRGLKPEDFPLIPKISEKEVFSINSSSFCHSLKQVVDFPQFSSTRPEISGIFFSFQPNLIKIVATDSFRLAEKKLFLEKPLVFSHSSESQEYSFILPQKTAREVINIFEEKEGDLHIYFSPNQVLFESLMTETKHPHIHLVSKLIEGDYPNYEEIIPKGFKTQLSLQRGEFLNQIKMASLFSGKINEVKLRVDPKKSGVEIFSQNPEFGEHQALLPAKINGQAVEIAFNYKFLIDGLLNIKSSEVIFELNGEDGPGVLKPVGDQSYIYVVMPIKPT